MNILFVVPYVPDLIRVRSYNLIRSLSKRGHRITIVTLWENEKEFEAMNCLKEMGFTVYGLPLKKWHSFLNCLLALPTRRPLQSVYCWSPDLGRLLTRILDESVGESRFDIIHVEHLRGSPYALFLNKLKAANSFQPPIVWDSVDCISYLFQQSALQNRKLQGRLISLFDLSRTKSYEGFLLSQFDHTLITTAIDRDAILELHKRYRLLILEKGNQKRAPAINDLPPVSLIPNGVDLNYFTPKEEERKPDTILFSGKMSYHANITAAHFLVKEIMPLIWAKRPQVKLIIAGKDPPPDILALQSHNHPNILITGTVPDIRPYLRCATVAVIPLIYGAGSQLKVLEAMACATPIVATSKAISALSVEAGQDLLIADDAEGIASRVLETLSDAERQKKLGQAGRSYVEKNHDWEKIAAKLEDIYAQVIESKKGMM
jgi:polysaccharide biosynthesis protein PslH